MGYVYYRLTLLCLTTKSQRVATLAHRACNFMFRFGLVRKRQLRDGSWEIG